MRPAFAVGIALALAPVPSTGAEGRPLPRVAEGWSIGLIAEAPEIAFPTAVVAAPDGTIYLGQDPMDMPGPPTEPIDSVVAIRGGRASVFADKLWSVMGLEWLDGTLFVVHAPYLSAFRDLDGDGVADRRVDLVTGLGPRIPGFNGINDHVASGIRLGMDGFLYVAVGDKGIPRGVGLDGSTVTMATGGVIRIRPDGTGLEVVSTGERNPLSVALTASDDVFTYGNDDDSKRWPNSLTHHIVGGHHGYPYEFLAAPGRCLPIVDGQFGGSGTQGICSNEDGLPDRFRGNLFFCDWGLQAVFRSEVVPLGGTFRLVRREPIVEKGPLADFRPFAIAPDADGSSLLLVDWAFNGWLADVPKAGRLFRLTYTGPDRVRPAPRPTSPDLAALVEGLDHPALSARLASQRQLASRGVGAVTPLIRRLEQAGPRAGRVHALWALDAIGSPEARRAIGSAVADPDASVRAQAARSSGIRRDRREQGPVATALRDPEAAVRREAAIALGRMGDASAGPALHAALGDPDPFVAWSVRHAIRALDAWDESALLAALGDPRRRDDALKLADGSWAVPAVRALAGSLAGPGDPAWRSRVVATLGGLYRRYPAWSGRWFGTNPLAGVPPRKTEGWSPEGMDAVFVGLARALGDEDPSVRRSAIVGLIDVGGRALPVIRVGLAREPDAVNLAALARFAGSTGDLASIPPLARLLRDPARPVEVREAALDALAAMDGPQALKARFQLVYDPEAPGSLVARALPPLGRARVLPANDLAGFLDHKDDAVRAAALSSFPGDRPTPAGVGARIVAGLDDPSPGVRKAAIGAIAVHRLRDAVPRLVALADRDGDRAEAARALAAIPDARALPAYIAALKGRDPDLRRAAESALVAIRDVAAGDLESRARRGEFVGPSALAVERILTRFVPVVDWKVIGPFPRTTPPAFSDPIAIDFGRTHSGAEGRPISWQPREGDPATGRVVVEDLKAGAGDRGGFGYDAGGSPDLAAFAYAEVTSPGDRPAILLVGSSGPIQVAVNGRAALNVGGAAGRAFAPDSDLVRVALKAGTNRIVVRSRQGIGRWSFGVQVSEPGPAAAAGTAGVEGLRAFALTHPGDPRNGEAIFFDPDGIGCVRCHAAGGKGTATIGPDLAGLAARYDKAEIVRSVLEPSARIATGYQPVVIARVDGTILAGIVRSETDAHLELVDAEARSIRIPRSEIAERRIGDVSTMPTALVDALSPVEFADLIAYLTGLKAGGSGRSSP